MKQESESFDSLAEALAAFQKEHHAAGKDGSANYGTYTTLAGGLSAAQPATKYGLSHVQTFDHLVLGDQKVITILVTTLMHTSGQSIKSELPFPELVPNRGNIMQALGSAVTYARRYALLAIYGLAGDDDDANGSVGTAPPSVKKGISRTPTKLATSSSQPAKKEESRGVVFIDPSRKARIVDALRSLESQSKKDCLDTFKKECNISAAAVSPEHVTLPKHGDVLERLLKLAPYVPST